MRVTGEPMPPMFAISIGLFASIIWVINVPNDFMAYILLGFFYSAGGIVIKVPDKLIARFGIKIFRTAYLILAAACFIFSFFYGGIEKAMTFFCAALVINIFASFIAYFRPQR